VRGTLKEMSRLVRQFKTDGQLRELSQRLTAHLTPYDRVGEISALHLFVRDRIRYVNDVNDVETLQWPTYTCEVGSGDCDDKSILLNTLLESIGYKTLFFAIGLQGSDYSHVMSGVRLGTRTIPLETIVPPGALGPGSGEMGWMSPDADPVLPWNV
jgi:hypothetical protein